MRPVFVTTVACVVSFGLPCAHGQTPSAEQILKQFRPAQRNVVFDTPDPKDFPNCRVEIERGTGTAGFVVYGPAGQVLRRFTDTNADSKADLFRFYQMGLEVYRDIDSDKPPHPIRAHTSQVLPELALPVEFAAVLIAPVPSSATEMVQAMLMSKAHSAMDLMSQAIHPPHDWLPDPRQRSVFHFRPAYLFQPDRCSPRTTG